MPLRDQLGQALVERLHAQRLRRSGSTEYICAILPSRIRLRMAGVPIMISCAATRPPPVLLQQRLRDHRAQRLGQHRAHHVLLLAREHVDDAVDGLGGRAGVQGAEHQVAGLGGGQRQADGLQVAHFADQDDVRVLAQRRAQRLAEAERVAVAPRAG